MRLVKRLPTGCRSATEGGNALKRILVVESRLVIFWVWGFWGEWVG